MRRNLKMTLASVGAIIALAGGTTLYAQTDKPQTHGGMMHGPGDMKNMPDMMARMNPMGPMSPMMESCNKMMQGATNPGETEKSEANPASGSAK